MVIGINCGHTVSGAGSGAVGIVRESEQTRLVGHALMSLLRSAGATVIDCTIDKANTQAEYLAAAVALGNRQDLDWFISIHFNATASHTGHGTEVYTYKGQKFDDAVSVAANISRLGFDNRGVKDGSGLYVIHKTKAKSMLIECCFCDNTTNVQKYNEIGGAAGMAKAIYAGIYHQTVEIQPATENHDLSHDDFIKFIGTIAQKDWLTTHRVLPSIVLAQAIKESGWGKSELATKANALFGIKLNGWTGRTYCKDATEQNKDGTYRVDRNCLWRAYDSWHDSIIDHNDYIAGRSTDGKVKRFGAIVGNTDYRAVAQILQDKSYATAQNYATSLVNDYILKYNLSTWDNLEPDVLAEQGTLWIVQAGAYRSKNNAIAFQHELEAKGLITSVHNYHTD